MSHDLKCPECGAPMRLIRSGPYKPFYGCQRYPICKGTHCAHPDGTPMGTPANAETKAMRHKAHEAFDSLWKPGTLSRGQAYAWLRKMMRMTPEECHIGLFGIAECQRVIELVGLFNPADCLHLPVENRKAKVRKRRFQDMRQRK